MNSVPDVVAAAADARERVSARSVVRGAIARAVERLEVELPRARDGSDPEGVHQARVATRRLRSDLRTFAPLLDAEWRAATRDELRWLADALGAVRDTDVLRMHLERAIAEVGTDDIGARRMLAELATRERAARAALVAALDDPRTGRLLEALRAAAVDPPTVSRALGPARRRLRPLIRRPWRQLDRAVRHLGDEPPLTELHRIRLLAKRTRYAAEAVAPAFGSDARRFGKAVARLQEALGELHDAEVLEGWLRDTAPSLDPIAAFAAGELAHHVHLAARAHRHGWEPYVDRARRRSGWLD